MRLIEQTVPKDDSDPNALATYGLLVRYGDDAEETWLCFANGRP